MGLLSRVSTVFKAKVNTVLDQIEDPRETLDYSYQKQLELLQKVKRSLADVATSRKMLELQKARLEGELAKLDGEARSALGLGREDLARSALERKSALQAQLDSLGQQIDQLKDEEDKMVTGEKRLMAKIESFRSQKEVIKAQFSSAEAQVKIGEAATGISEELADVGMAVERAQDKTQRMKARASAIDDLTASGALDDLTLGHQDPVQAELEKVKRQSDVDSELARMKSEMAGGKP